MKQQQQDRSGLPQTRVRCRRVSLPVLNGDRLKAAKTLVDKAVKEKKVFTIQGPYSVIRAGLRARGWVERRLPRHSLRSHCHGNQDTEGMEETDSSDDDDDRGPEGDREEETDDIHNLMSRLARNETTYFYWTTKRDSVDYLSLQKDQMTNHYAKAGSFTTKVGLCMSLKNLQWFDSTDADTFFPRCYRLGAEDEKQAFTEDFRRTACTSLLRYVVERAEGQRKDERTDKHCKPQAQLKIGSGLIDTALHVCQEHLNSLDHCDIDISLQTPPILSEQQWEEFIHNYYLVIHDGLILEGCTEYLDHCRSMLTRMQKVCPQLETDGVTNIWIIKPGAKSRGRDIVCINRLEKILSLVASDPAMVKDNKWVAQKYIERPLLIHGTKFDLRQWFLVTDWNPLTVWLYDECYLRFSTQLYSTHKLDSSVHLCNNSIQKHFQPDIGRDPSLPAESMWSCSEFRSWLAASGRDSLWEEVVLPGMRRAIIQTLLTAQDSVEPRKASFELYGADFLLGQDLHPWLLEVNVSPTMATSTFVTAQLCPAVQEDTLRVVLDRRYDRNANTGGFQLIFKQATIEVPQYVGVNLLVEGAQIRLPRSSQFKTSVQCQNETLHKSRPSLPTCALTSAKMNPPDEEKKQDMRKPGPAVSSRKVAIERSLTFQPLVEKRCHRSKLLSPLFPLPTPSSHPNHHAAHTHVHVNTEHLHSRKQRAQRTVLTLKRFDPTLQIISLKPELTYNRTSSELLSRPAHTVRVSHPQLHMNQYYSLFHQQNS